MPIFQRPPMRLTPSDTGDHVNLRKIALRSSQSHGKGLYCQSLPRPDLSEIFAVALLPTFSTVSARSCHTTTDKVQRVLRFPSRNSIDRILDPASPKQAAFGNKQRRVQPSITLRPCIETYRQTHVLVTPCCRLI